MDAIVIWAENVPRDYDNDKERIKLYNWEEFMELGNKNIEKLNQEIEKRINNISPEQC